MSNKKKKLKMYANMSLWNKLRRHIGHNVAIVAHGDPDDPDRICLECKDCYREILDTESCGMEAQLLFDRERLRQKMEQAEDVKDYLRDQNFHPIKVGDKLGFYCEYGTGATIEQFKRDGWDAYPVRRCVEGIPISDWLGGTDGVVVMNEPLSSKDGETDATPDNEPAEIIGRNQIKLPDDGGITASSTRFNFYEEDENKNE